jgi:hypothetical protein
MKFLALLRPSTTNTRRLRPWQADLSAVAVTTATFGLRLALFGQLAGQPTLVIFTVPIMASAYLGGLRAGLVSTALAVSVRVITCSRRPTILRSPPKRNA